MGGNVERHIGDDDRDGAAIEALQPGGNGMTHAARDVLAERDETQAQVAAAYRAAERALEARKYGDPDEREEYAFDAALDRGIVAIRTLTPADAQAALETYGREKVREGMRLAAGLIAKRRDDYISEYGIYDPTTGVTEFPGNGDEYVSELDDCEAAILADMEKLK